MKKITLKSFSPVGEKWSFVLERENERAEITLREKASWPAILHAPVNLVEQWLFRNYGEACQLAFGLI